MEDDKREALVYIQKEKIAKIANTADDDDHLQELISQMRKYKMYRKNYAANIVFDPSNTHLSKRKPKAT